MPTSVLASLIFRSISVAGVVLIAAGCASTASRPSAATAGPIGYATDGSGNLAHGGDGRCVRTGAWEPQYAIKECDPELVAQAAPPPTPPQAAAQEPQPSEQESSQQAAQAEPTPQESTTSAAEAPQTEESASAPQATEPSGTAGTAGAAGAAAAAAQPPAEEKPVYVGADAYFAFDRSDLTDKGKHALDAIAERATKLQNISVRVVGYADQIGTDEYNMALSQRRADAVKTYLVEHGVPENALSVDARGEADPIVRCEGRQGATLINCLQPNRRTEVEFSALAPPQ